MVERREKTTTEGRGLGFSFAADNVVRGDPDIDFVKRKPTYPIGDNPRAREIDFGDQTGDQAYTGKQIFRAYRGKYPLEGQPFGMPSRVGQLSKPQDLRPDLPPQSTDDAANAAAQELELQSLVATDFQALFPSTEILEPAPAATFSPGDQILVRALSRALRNLHRATLFIDGQPVDVRTLDRRDQDHTKAFIWQFYYTIPSNRPTGPMEITVRAFNMSNSFQSGLIADDAINAPPKAEPIQGAKPTIDGTVKGSATASSEYQPLLDGTGYLRTPGGAATLSVTIV